MEGRGMNGDLLRSLREAMGVAEHPGLRGRALREALKGHKKAGKAFLEVYRGLLLGNLKSMTTNLLGNTMETMVIPASKMVGNIATLNVKGFKEEIGFVWNMVRSVKKATMAGFDSLIHERNLLDPLRTKAETFSGETTRGFYMQMDKAVEAGYWHPQNWIPFVVNSFGKVSRTSLRVLGAQDEFFKVLTYNGKAMSKIAKHMPENLSRSQKKDFIKRNLDLFYDDTGEAIDRELLEYSRRTVFQEGLEKGSPMSNLHRFVDAHPATAGIILPFVRTPANILSRFVQRTPIANALLSRRTKDMLKSGDPDQIAEVIGNTIMGVGLYGTALSYSMDGTITGAGPVDREKNQLWRSAGFKPYSIKIGDTWYKYDRLEPASLPFVFVSTLHENLYRFQEDPESLTESIGVFIATSTKAIVDRTWLRGLKGFVDGIDTAVANNDVLHFAGGFGRNLIPSIINQVHRQSGLAEEESGAYAFRQANTILEKILSKLPPIEGYSAIKHNWLTGQPMLLPTGHDFGLDSFSENEEPNKYMEELLRFGQTIQPVSKKIGNVELNGSQYARLNELTGTTEIEGRTLMEALEELMDSPEYDFDEDRVYHPDFPSPQTKAVKRIIGAFKEKGRYDLLNEDDELYIEWEKNMYDKAEIGMGLDQ